MAHIGLSIYNGIASVLSELKTSQESGRRPKSKKRGFQPKLQPDSRMSKKYAVVINISGLLQYTRVYYC